MSVGLSAIQATENFKGVLKIICLWSGTDCHDWQRGGYLGLLCGHFYNVRACQVVCVPVTVAYGSRDRQIWRAQGPARLAETIRSWFTETLSQNNKGVTEEEAPYGVSIPAHSHATHTWHSSCNFESDNV